jgi:hypothetical protein
MGQDVVDFALANLQPLANTPNADFDFWFRYLDSDDVAKWTVFIGDALPQVVDRFETSLK